MYAITSMLRARPAWLAGATARRVLAPRSATVLAAGLLAPLGCYSGELPDGANASDRTDAELSAAARAEDPPARLPSDTLVVPGLRIGPVTASTTEEGLIRGLGPDRVVRYPYEVGEGLCGPGSRLDPSTPLELDVLWTDSTRQVPAEVRVSRPDALWRTPAGVRIGTTLDELETIAERAVRFSGFGWDYGGSGSWTEVVDGDSASIGIMLSPTRESTQVAAADPRYREILGERSVSSTHPLIQNMDIRLWTMWVRWESGATTAPCPGRDG